MNENYRNIQLKLEREHVTLVAVSKTKSVDEIMQLYAAGQRDFGENRVQELRAKQEQLPKDIRWHMIGHLQENKLKYIAGWIHLIQSVDSQDLLLHINKHGQKCNRVISCLIQVHIAQEDTKFGFTETALDALLRSEVVSNLQFVRICGLMGMATNTSDVATVRNEFIALRALFRNTKEKYFSDSGYFATLSMGMSSDYKIAIEEGSTMVRIGSLLFGNRTESLKKT